MSICELCYLLGRNCVGIVVVSSNNDSKQTICSLNIRASIIVVVSIQKHVHAMLSPSYPFEMEEFHIHLVFPSMYN
jgi:hypothetical protein